MHNVIYITGLSGSGKTTIGKALQQELKGSILLDGDIIRSSINSDLGYEPADKVENIRRNNALAVMLYKQGLTVICCFLASIEGERNKLFHEIPDTVKVQLTTPLEICIQRDPKGLYKKKLKNFAGTSWEYPLLNDPALKIDTTKETVKESVDTILRELERLSYGIAS